MSEKKNEIFPAADGYFVIIPTGDCREQSAHHFHPIIGWWVWGDDVEPIIAGGAMSRFGITNYIVKDRIGQYTIPGRLKAHPNFGDALAAFFAADLRVEVDES